MPYYSPFRNSKMSTYDGQLPKIGDIVAKIVLTESEPSEPFNLKLETRNQNTIENYQCRDALKYGQLQQAFDLLKDYPRAVIRGNPTGYYNCHGLTFACRRTAVISLKTLDLIFKDDDYQEIEFDEILPGDLVVYIDDIEKDITHTAFLVGNPEAKTGEIWVVSKWGIGPEVVHRLQDCPYGKDLKRFYRMEKCHKKISRKIEFSLT
jgi:hypothetical protein